MNRPDPGGTESSSPGPRRFRRLLAEVFIILLVIGAIRWYQTRDLLPADARVAAPAIELETPDGRRVSLQELRGRPTLVYFFAPWCTVCNLSASNLQALRASQPESELAIVLVALDYASDIEVREFIEGHELDLTVLLGSRQTAADYRIHGFPTYYVLDAQGRVVSRDYGYSSYAGLLWRTWRAR